MSRVSENIFEFASVPYKESINKELKKSIIFGVLAFSITALGSNEWLLSIPVGMLGFGVFFYKAKRWYKFNIEKVEVNNIVQLEYTEKGEMKSVRSPFDKVKVSKKMGISKGRVPYLTITFIESGETITQYEVGAWVESEMDNVKNKLEND
jgi:hypothetical protein